MSLTVACPDESAVVPRARELGVAHIPWDATREPGLTVIGETRRLGRIIEHVQPDILHLHSSKAGLAGRLAARGTCRTVFQPNGWSFDAVMGLTRRGALAWERYAARWTHLLVCVSTDELRRASEAGIGARARVVPNGVDLEAFGYADATERSSARRRLELAPNPLAVCIGRLTRQKGQDILLDAWRIVMEAIPDARLVLVGDGPDRPSLEGRHTSSVTLVGFRTDVHDWLAAADVVVVPSRWEGMPLTMLESMAVGRSVVATDVSGTHEALGDSAGRIVPTGNIMELAAAIVERLREPTLAAAEGAAGRERAERSHDVRKTTAAVTALYAELAPKRR